MRILGGSVLAMLLVLTAAPAGADKPVAAFDADPVVLVHGCMFVSARAAWGVQRDPLLDSYWGPMVEGLREAGYPESHIVVVRFTDPCGDNRRNAVELAAAVDAVRAETGSKRVDLVGHSMACLSTRLYVGAHGGARVDDLVSIAGGCHGTDFPEIPSAPVRQLALTALTANGENAGIFDVDVAYRCDGIQKELNGCFDSSGVRIRPHRELPGHLPALSIYTEPDELIQPAHSACLAQAHRGDCSDPLNVFVPGRSHFSIHQDADVVDRTIRFIAD